MLSKPTAGEVPSVRFSLALLPMSRDLLAAADQGRIDADVFLPVEVDQREGAGDEIPHGVADAGGHHEIVRFRQVEHGYR